MGKDPAQQTLETPERAPAQPPDRQLVNHTLSVTGPEVTQPYSSTKWVEMVAPVVLIRALYRGLQLSHMAREKIPIDVLRKGHGAIGVVLRRVELDLGEKLIPQWLNRLLGAVI
jgi:hypothetical protein